MADIRQVTPRFAVAPQIEAGDFSALAAAGFRSVINNRPDGEVPGQMGDAEAKKAAEDAGLIYLSVPFIGDPTPDQAEAVARFLETAPSPVLAYCRTGTRSIKAWALAQAMRQARDSDELIGLSAKAGYDLSGLKPALERAAGG